jgi:hypothetical protein
MSSHNVSDTLLKERPTVKLQIGINGYKMVLCFSKVEQAKQYFTSVYENIALNPWMSDNSLEVSLDLRKARKIVLGKGSRRPFKIQFRTCWSARKWHQLSNSSHLYSRQGRCVLIAEPNTNSFTHRRVDLLLMVEDIRPVSKGMMPSPPTAIGTATQRAESLWVKIKSAWSNAL